MTALLPTLLLTVFSGSHFCYKLQDILQESYLGTLEGSSFPQKRLFSEMIIHLSIRLSRSMFNIISYLLFSRLLIRALCLTRIINPIHVIDAINACFHIYENRYKLNFTLYIAHPFPRDDISYQMYASL